MREIWRIHGDIDNNDGRAGDTGREPRVDTFCAGAKKESQTAAAPAQRILDGLEGLPTSEIHVLCLKSSVAAFAP